MGSVSHLVDAGGLWCETLPHAVRGGPALFVDRDGVVVAETEYLCRVEDVALISGLRSLLPAASDFDVRLGQSIQDAILLPIFEHGSAKQNLVD